MEYNLREAVSEECYNDIMAKVQENLENVMEEQHAFATMIEKGLHKHGPGILSAAVKGAGDTINNVKNAAVSGLANSNNKFSNTIKNLPGVKSAVVNHIRKQHSAAVKKAASQQEAALNKNRADFATKVADTNMISNPAVRARALSQVQDNAAQRHMGIRRSYNNQIQQAKDTKDQQMSSIKK